MARHFFGLLLFLAVTVMQTFVADALIIDHHHTDTHLIPDVMITQAKNTLHIAYQHTSHGSQIVTGMGALRGYPSFGGKYDFDDAGVRAGALDFDDDGIPGGSSDLSTGDYLDDNGVTPWVTATRNLLNNTANNHINVIVWSWCSINGHDIPRYLTNMEILVAEYGTGGTKPRAVAHPVTFVFMTGHAEGQGEGGDVHAANQKIRQHCLTNGRVLFDFADIESYNPDGEYFYDRYMYDNLDYGTAANSTGNWGTEWITAHIGSELERLTTGNGVGGGYTGCTGCTHSDNPAEASINCVLKGRAFWWLLAAIADNHISAKSDFNGDWKPDILWKNTSTGQNYVWYMSGTNGSTRASGVWIETVADLNWKIVGTGDFNGDGKPDILWRNTSTGQNYVWYMSGTNGSIRASGAWIEAVADLSWTIVGTGDFNGDGKPDILWRNTSTGQNYVWYMGGVNGATRASGSWIEIVADLSWTIVGTGDFNSDGKPDILWRNTATGQNYIWYMNGANGATRASGTWIETVADLSWKIVGTGDFNSDGKRDILWRNTSTGGNYVWYMSGANGATRASGAWIETVADLNWEIVNH